MHIDTVLSAYVDAFDVPPFSDKYVLYAFSLGYFFVPRNSMCSQKCANPGKLSGSLMCPTSTVMAAAALSVAGSLMSSTFRPFVSCSPRYSRLSCCDFTISLTRRSLATSAIVTLIDGSEPLLFAKFKSIVV